MVYLLKMGFFHGYVIFEASWNPLPISRSPRTVWYFSSCKSRASFAFNCLGEATAPNNSSWWLGGTYSVHTRFILKPQIGFLAILLPLSFFLTFIKNTKNSRCQDAKVDPSDSKSFLCGDPTCGSTFAPALVNPWTNAVWLRLPLLILFLPWFSG
jgi:hypothetical protein